MSVQFGRWNFAGETPALEYVEKVSASIAPYGPDSSGSYSRSGICILYRGFHTTKETRREKQPHICPSGAVLTWDGRLDNRDELIAEWRSSLGSDDTDVAIVAAAFETWGTDCFAKLIGDWALSIWDPRRRSLILAKDPIGPRQLYYAVEEDRITWCTVLDPLVLFADKTFKLCEEYIAGWLSRYPATHLTPYEGINSVPPSACVFLGQRKHIVAKYWDFDPGKKLRYRSDAEYEEHFRTIFFKAVQRRLRSDAPVLAELSGGRDSSSIVCVADEIMVRGEGEAPRLDTISWYDDSEPNWNERPYFTKIEEQRGRRGWQIDVGPHNSNDTFRLESNSITGYHFLPIPCQNPRIFEQLQDLLASGRVGMLASQLKAWALQKKKPWFHLLLDAIRGFLPYSLVGVPKYMRPAPWVQRSFMNCHSAALVGYPIRMKLFGALPSFLDSVSTLYGMQRQVATKSLSAEVLYEKRYPYLDVTLLEFMCAIPREQSVRPTQRRSLMRRALSGIVPDEVLNRSRKGFVTRAPLVSLSKHFASLTEMTEHMVSESFGIIDSKQLRAALSSSSSNDDFSSLFLWRTIHLEGWMRRLLNLGFIEVNRTTPYGIAECRTRKRVDMAQGNEVSS